jgi:DNA-binding HxlR family transcriptional regulator
MHSSENCRSNCPINFALETLGDRWTLLIVRDLLFKGKRTYGEFLDSQEGISTNILAGRLRRLKDHGIVMTDAANDKRSILYRLTPKGLDLLPVMLELTAWSAKYDSQTNAPENFALTLKEQRLQLMDSILSKLK